MSLNFSGWGNFWSPNLLYFEKKQGQAEKACLQMDDIRQEAQPMKGYFVEDGYMGYVDGSYVLFADERDYWEFVEEAS